ncbi:MAG: hypothetical protein WCG47_01580 [Dermatophilaceae bacterium]
MLETLRVQCGTSATDETRAAIYLFSGEADLRRTDWVGRNKTPRDAFRASDVPYGRNVTEFAATARGRWTGSRTSRRIEPHAGP